MVIKIFFLGLLLFFVCSVRGEFNLTVVHISDFHSHWFEFDENKHDCSKQESAEGKCYGGFARLLSFVQDIRKREKNVLVLSSGEFFVGRTLHALDGWKLAHALVPKLELDAMSLSNHDFDNGILELAAFLYSMKFPVLCANMDARRTSFLYSRVNKSAILDVGGRRIGVVGYIHRNALMKTKKMVSLKFLPEIPALQEEVSRLESEGVDKIIALGHAGYYTDLEIARKVKGVDIVIGGDSDIMLFDPGNDADELSKVGNIHGNYPRIHHQEPKLENDTRFANRTLVLHIPQHGMYVGVLRATFDEQGKIIHESGEPVLLDNSIPQDQETLDFLQFAKGALEKLAEHMRLPDKAELLGKTSQNLDGNPRNCRMRECSLGNFIADAFLHEFTFHYRSKSEDRDETEQWGPIDAVVFNSGQIRKSIEPGYITIDDILKAVRLGGFIKRVYMSGKQLMDMMEHSVKHYDPKGVNSPGAFLQVSGLKVEYDLSHPPGNRVKNLTIRCRDCGNNTEYFPVKLYKTYIIGMPTYLRDGRDGFYDHFDETVEEVDQGQFDALLLVEYLRRTYEIEPMLDGRIKFLEPADAKNIFYFSPLPFGDPTPTVHQSEYSTTVSTKIHSTTSTVGKTNDANEVARNITGNESKIMSKKTAREIVRNAKPELLNKVATVTVVKASNITSKYKLRNKLAEERVVSNVSSKSELMKNATTEINLQTSVKGTNDEKTGKVTNEELKHIVRNDDKHRSGGADSAIEVPIENASNLEENTMQDVNHLMDKKLINTEKQDNALYITFNLTENITEKSNLFPESNANDKVSYTNATTANFSETGELDVNLTHNENVSSKLIMLRNISSEENETRKRFFSEDKESPINEPKKLDYNNYLALVKNYIKELFPEPSEVLAAWEHYQNLMQHIENGAEGKVSNNTSKSESKNKIVMKRTVSNTSLKSKLTKNVTPDINLQTSTVGKNDEEINKVTNEELKHIGGNDDGNINGSVGSDIEISDKNKSDLQSKIEKVSEKDRISITKNLTMEDANHLMDKNLTKTKTQDNPLFTIFNLTENITEKSNLFLESNENDKYVNMSSANGTTANFSKTDELKVNLTNNENFHSMFRSSISSEEIKVRKRSVPDDIEGPISKRNKPYYKDYLALVRNHIKELSPESNEVWTQVQNPEQDYQNGLDSNNRKEAKAILSQNDLEAQLQNGI